jgi:uncharacterized protein with PIN domain
MTDKETVIKIMNTCSICLDNMDTDIYKTECKHEFHEDCIREYVNYINRDVNRSNMNFIRCPLCNKEIKIAEKENVYTTIEKFTNVFVKVIIICIVLAIMTNIIIKSQ